MVTLQIDGKEIKNAHILSRIVANTPPETQVVIDIIRGGKESKVSVTIGTMPTQGGGTQPAEEESPWGLTVQDLTPDLAERLGLSPADQGVVVTQVESGSPADEAGVKPGDLIKEINRQQIQDVDDYTKAIQAAGKDENLLLLIRRGEGSIFIVLKPASKQ